MLSTEDRIFVAGHRGMVGSALMRKLNKDGFTRLVTRTHEQLDLTDQAAVNDFFRHEKIDAVFLAAAKVGGIHANNVYRADFIYQNLMIECNVIQAAFRVGIERLLFLGSSCIYPRQCPQPMLEEHLLSGYLEPTNEPYAVAKIAGIKLCESYNRQYGTNFRSVMPTNLYGPNDNFDLQNSHVLPAMIRKFHLAKLASKSDTKAIEVDAAVFGPIPGDILQELGQNPPRTVLWGSGAPKREFLHVDDMAAACLFVMQLTDEQYRNACAPAPDGPSSEDAGVYHLNIGSGREIAIKELAEKINEVVGFQGETVWDTARPDGMLKKLMDSSRLRRAGWRPEIDLRTGIEDTYARYLSRSEIR